MEPGWTWPGIETLRTARRPARTASPKIDLIDLFRWRSVPLRAWSRAFQTFAQLPLSAENDRSRSCWIVGWPARRIDPAFAGCYRDCCAPGRRGFPQHGGRAAGRALGLLRDKPVAPITVPAVVAMMRTPSPCLRCPRRSIRSRPVPSRADAGGKGWPWPRMASAPPRRRRDSALRSTQDRGALPAGWPGWARGSGLTGAGGRLGWMITSGFERILVRVPPRRTQSNPSRFLPLVPERGAGFG